MSVDRRGATLTVKAARPLQPQSTAPAMSLFKLFQRKPAGDGASAPAAAADAGDSRFAGPASRPGPSDAEIIAQRRNERNERRELLYSVVRESMVRAGVLSSAYKFKVLSLDQRGRQFMIMMDLSREMGADPHRFGDIEVLIAQSAKAKFDILVTSVYWRISDHNATSLPGKAPTTTTVRPKPPAPAPAPAPAPVAAAPVAAAPMGAGTDEKASGFPDTEVIERDPPQSGMGGLSNTQYGDLR